MFDKSVLVKIIFTLTLTCLFLAASFAVEPGYSVGKEAPDFKLMPVGGGKPVSLSQLRGKPVVVVYWAAWCGPCRKEIPELKKLYDKYSPKGVQFVSIAVGWKQSEDDVAKFKTAQSLPYQVLFDKDNKVAQEWKIQSIPTNLIIDLDGVIRYREYAIFPEAEDILQSMIRQDT